MKTINRAQYTRTCIRYHTVQRKKSRSPKLRVLLGVIYACIIHGWGRGHEWAVDAAHRWRVRGQEN